MTIYRPVYRMETCAGCGVSGGPDGQIPVGFFDPVRKAHAMRWFCRDGVTTKKECRDLYNEKVESA